MVRSTHSNRLSGLILIFFFVGSAAFAQSDEPIKPIPVENRLDTRKVALGERLFHDKRLSKDNSISCASCHSLTQGGADGRTMSIGVGGAIGATNTPTVFNSSLNFRQFWDGRANSLEEQIDGPIHNPKEMGSSWAEVLARLSKDADLSAQFREIYPTGLQTKNVRDALATFERSLLTPNARFDKYLRGDTKALSASEIKGYQLFKSYGCVACHQGVNVGGNMFQTFGVMADYFSKRGNITQADLGRYNVTKNEADKHVFKVPGLRNVALTAPYFHDGSARNLSEAVDVMFKYQLGRDAPPLDKMLIIKFLGTLTGEYKGQPLDRIEKPAAH
ncbi:MAG TPA: cytochrome-c peroxidase [Noviherbaspirillum sp.]